jgi:hypothetical protein
MLGADKHHDVVRDHFALLFPDKISQDHYLIYNVGTLISIDDGLSRFNDYLRTVGLILIGGLEVVDFLYGDGGILYVVVYTALPKLEYLEYMYKRSVDKNI